MCKHGLWNTQADALSRLVTLGETKSDLDDEIPCFTIERDSIVRNDGIDFIAEEDAEFDEMLIAENAEPTAELLTPVSVEELLQAQATDPFCRELRSRLNVGEVPSFFDHHRGYLVRVVQKKPKLVIPFALRARILHLEHYPKVVSHPCGRKFYFSLRENFYWSSMALDWYATVKKCVACAKNRVRPRKRTKFICLFPEKAIGVVSINIIGELVRTPRRNKFLLVITDRFYKLVRIVPMRRITAVEIAKASVHDWVFVYGPLLTLLSDNGIQFAARLFIDFR